MIDLPRRQFRRCDADVKRGIGRRRGDRPFNAVEELGLGVNGFEIGEMVYGMVHTGAFAKRAAVRAADMVRTPVNLGAVDAASLPLAGSTAWQALFDEAGLKANQRLFITNGSGGVGSLAVQFAKARGAHVTAMASGRNERFVRDLGADAFVDHRQQRFEDVVRDIAVVFHTVGGETFERAFTVLRRGGAMVTVVAFTTDETERYGVRVARSFTRPNAANLAEITRLVEDGKVVPRIDTVLPFAGIRDALARSEAGRARGKIVLSIASG